MLPTNSNNKITVVNPATACPENYILSDCIPSSTANTKNTTPKNVTICIGAALNDVILFTAYRTNDLNDHLDSPASRSCTSNSTYVVLNPTQDDNARKNTLRSGSFRNSSAACRFLLHH